MADPHNPKDVAQAVVDKINAGGPYGIAFTARRVPMRDRDFDKVKETQVIVAPADKTTEPNARNSRNALHTMSVAIQSPSLRTVTNETVDPFVDLTTKIEAVLVDPQSAFIVVEGANLHGREITYDGGFYRLDFLLNDSVYLSTFTINYLMP